MPLPDLSNEQKLTYIYLTLKDQESRRKRAMWYKFFKWIVIFGLIFLVYTYPKEISSKFSELIRPIIMEQVDTMKQEYQNTLIKSIKDILPADMDIGPAPTSTSSGATTPKKTATGTTQTKTPVKK